VIKPPVAHWDPFDISFNAAIRVVADDLKRRMKIAIKNYGCGSGKAG
jgi:hypothetical protein